MLTNSRVPLYLDFFFPDVRPLPFFGGGGCQIVIFMFVQERERETNVPSNADVGKQGMPLDFDGLLLLLLDFFPPPPVINIGNSPHPACVVGRRAANQGTPQCLLHRFEDCYKVCRQNVKR